jgi:hypothetical protein
VPEPSEALNNESGASTSLRGPQCAARKGSATRACGRPHEKAPDESARPVGGFSRG